MAVFESIICLLLGKSFEYSQPLRGAYSAGDKIAPLGANYFISKWIPIDMGGNNMMGRIVLPASVSILHNGEMRLFIQYTFQ